MILPDIDTIVTYNFDEYRYYTMPSDNIYFLKMIFFIHLRGVLK